MPEVVKNAGASAPVSAPPPNDKKEGFFISTIGNCIKTLLTYLQ